MMPMTRRWRSAVGGGGGGGSDDGGGGEAADKSFLIGTLRKVVKYTWNYIINNRCNLWWYSKSDIKGSQSLIGLLKCYLNGMVF